MVQRNVVTPTGIFETAVVGEVASAIVAEPLTMVHAPVPGAVTAVAAMVVLATPVTPMEQMSWSGPAFSGMTAPLNRVIVTCEVVVAFAHGPLLRVHWKTLAPIERPFTTVVGLFKFTNVPVPLTTVQTPVAGAKGEFPASVVVTSQTCCAGPALALGLAGLNTTISISSVVVGGVHGPLLMLQRIRFVPMERPLTVVLRRLALAKVPVP